MRDEFGVDMDLPLVRRCCVCKMFAWGQGIQRVWRDDLHFFPQAVNITDGYCPRCKNKIMEKIRLTRIFLARKQELAK